MVSRNIWPLSGLVCAAHFFLLQVFFDADGGARAKSQKSTQLSIELIKRAPLPVAVSEPVEAPKLPLPSPLADVKISPATVARQTPESATPPQQTVQSSGVDPTVDQSKFLDLEAIDEPAVNTSDFDPTLAKVLSGRFESIVLELFIDETGRTVQIACIEGDCSALADDGLQQLSLVPFSPAIKDGQTVPSRKVIQVSPTPSFGL